MKKISRRSFLQVAGATGAAGLMSACGADSSSATTGTTSTSTAASTADAAEEKVTIHFSYWIAEDDETNVANFAAAVAEFNESEPNIEVILDAQPTNKSDDYETKYSMLLLAGDKTDIVACKSIDAYSMNASRGLYASLDDYMAADGLSTDDFTISTQTSDGVYGLPMTTSANLVLINVDALEAAGMPWPSDDWTWEEDYREMARAMTTGDMVGSIMPYWSDPVMYYLGLAQNCDDNPLFIDETTHNLADPLLKEFLEYRYSMTQEGIDVSYVDYTTASLSYAGEFFNGNAAMVVTGPFSFSGMTDLTNFPHTFKTGVMHTPSFAGSEPGSERDGTGTFSVNAKIDDVHKEAAYKFIAYYSTRGMIHLSQIPCARDYDTELLLASITGDNPELVDTESLTHWMTNPIRNAKVAITNPVQTTEIKAIVQEEGDSYMSGGQSIDDAIANMCKRADVVMAQ